MPCRQESMKSSCYTRNSSCFISLITYYSDLFFPSTHFVLGFSSFKMLFKNANMNSESKKNVYILQHSARWIPCANKRREWMKGTYLNLCYVLILQNIPFSFETDTLPAVSTGAMAQIKQWGMAEESDDVCCWLHELCSCQLPLLKFSLMSWLIIFSCSYPTTLDIRGMSRSFLLTAAGENTKE